MINEILDNKNDKDFSTPQHSNKASPRELLTESVYQRKLETNIEHIDDLEAQIHIYKKLVCCYELNRQTVVKLIGFLVNQYPFITNDINKDVTENTMLLENIIEHYLAHVKFKVMDELENFNASANELTFISSKKTLDQKVNLDSSFYLQHPLNSSLCQQNEPENQNSSHIYIESHISN